MFHRLFQFLYPRRCFICHSAVNDVVLCQQCCAKTEQRFNYCHSCCGDVLSGSDCLPCQLNAHHHDIDHYIVGYRYHHAMRDAIIQLKFNHKIYMVRVVQELMNPILEEHNDILAEVDYIVPMPVDRVRLAGRGFNHMLEIANALQASISRPILHDVLYKHAFSIPQNNLSKQERSSNLQGAFESNQVHGHILLLDDVITTGKTLQFASQCLKNAGAERITALVLAKA